MVLDYGFLLELATKDKHGPWKQYGENINIPVAPL